MTSVIGLTGRKRSGKDSVADVLVRDHGFVRFAFADAIRDVVAAINPRVRSAGPDTSPEEQSFEHLTDIVAGVGWETAKAVPEVRRLLQATGMAVRRHDPGLWTRILADRITCHLEGPRSSAPVVVCDVRLPDEAAMIRDRFGGHLVRVVRPGLVLDLSSTASHITETALDTYPVDRELLNDATLDDLAGQAHALAAMFGGSDHD